MILESETRPIERLMSGAYDSIKGLISADTVVGNPIKADNGTVIIPVSKVTMGFITGGGEYGERQPSDPAFAGGSGAGMSVVPVGFLVSCGNEIKLVGIDDKSVTDKIIDLIPEAIRFAMNLIK